MPSSVLSSIRHDGDAPLTILLHGLQGEKGLFDRLILEPALRRHAVFVPDLPGFGDSRDFPLSAYNISNYAEIVAEAVNGYGGGEVNIIGHSLGAMIGAKLVSSRILNVRTLISLEGNLAIGDCGASIKIAEMKREDFCNRMLPSMLSELANLKAPSAQFRHQSLSRALPDAIYEAACSIVAESRSGSLFRDFEAARCRKLLLVGETSAFVTRTPAPSINVATVPNCGHFILHDNYPVAAQFISEFLTEVK